MSRTSKHIDTDLPWNEPSERCCGAACDQPARDNELKLIGAREFNRLLQHTIVMDDALKHCLDVVESEYHMSLVPLGH